MRITTTSFLIAVLIVGLAFLTNAIADTPDEKSDAKIRVGTFDSRALALAYYRSDQFSAHIKEMHKELETAKQAGDKKRIAELEAAGPELQELVHGQGFGTAPVDNILAKIKSRLPEIAKEANVDIIVSKWNIIYQRDNLEFVDVSNLIVKAFNPDESTLKVISDIMSQAPQPSDRTTGKLRIQHREK